MSAKALNRATLLLAAIGIFIAGVLTLAHYMNVDVPCGANQGCGRVAADPSSMFLNVPVALFGLAAYLGLMALALARGMLGIARSKPLVYIGYGVSGIGAVVSLYLTYYSIAKIGAECLWCLGSTAVMVASFLIHAMLAQNEAEPEPGSPKELKLGVALFAIAAFALGAQAMMLNRGKAIHISDAYKHFSNSQFLSQKPHILGAPDAPITIVEFGDLLCPTCKLHYNDIKDIVKESRGKIRFVFRHYPMFKLVNHQESMHGAVLAECADEYGKFWPFVDAVYALDYESVKDKGPYIEILKELGLPESLMDRIDDQNDPAFNRVYADIQAGHAAGVDSTPTYFLLADGQPPLAAYWEELTDDLDKEPYKSLLSHDKK